MMDAEELSKRCVLFKNVPANTTEKQFCLWIDCAQNGAFRNIYKAVHRHVDDEQDIRWIVLFQQEKDALDCIKAGEFEVSSQTNEAVKLIPDYCSECIVPPEWLTTHEDWVTVNRPEEQPFSLVPEDIRSNSKGSGQSNMSSITSEDLFGERNEDSKSVRDSKESQVHVIDNKFTDDESRISSSELFGSGYNRPVSPNSTSSSAMFGSGIHRSESLGFGENLTGTSPTEEIPRGTSKVLDNSKGTSGAVKIVLGTDQTGIRQMTRKHEDENIEKDCLNKESKKSDGIVEKGRATIETPASIKSKDTSDKSQSKSSEENNREGPQKGIEGHGETRISSEPNVPNVPMNAGYQYPCYQYPNPEEMAKYYQLYVTRFNQHSGTAEGTSQPFLPYPIMQHPTSQTVPLESPQSHTPAQNNMHVVYVPVHIPQMPGAMPGPTPMPGSMPMAHVPFGNMPGPTHMPGSMPMAHVPVGNMPGPTHMPGSVPVGHVPGGMPGLYFPNHPAYMMPNQGQGMHATDKVKTEPMDSEDNTYITPVSPKSPPAAQKRPCNSSVKSTESVNRHGYYKGDVRIPSELKRSETIEEDEADMEDDPIYSSINEETLVGDQTLRKIKSKSQSVATAAIPPNIPKRNQTMPSKQTKPKLIEQSQENTSQLQRLTILDDSKEDDTMKGKMIKIEGISNNVSVELIGLFVERPEVSGVAAEMTNMEICREKQEAIVKMNYASAVIHILEKQKSNPEVFKLGDKRVKISAYVPPPLDPRKVFISGMKEVTSQDSLQNFIEVCCGNVPTTIQPGLTPGTALLEFDTPPDIVTFKEKIKQRPLEDQFLKISEVEVTQSVKVKGYDPKPSHDALLYYFENRKRSGGGEVDIVEYQKENDVHIVRFLKPEDAVNACEREKHEVSGVTITVCLYHPCLDLAPEYKVIIPEPLEIVHLDPFIVTFLSKSSPYKMKFEMHMKQHCYAGVVWPSDNEDTLKLICNVDPKEKGLRDKLKDWHDKCKYEVDDICSDLAVNDEIHVAKEVWNGFRDRLNDVTFSEPDMVMIHIKREEYLITVFGLNQFVDSISQSIINIVSELEQKLTADQDTVTKSRFLKTYQAALLRYIKFAEKTTSSSLSVSMTDRQIEFNGTKTAVDDCIEKMYQKLRDFARRTVPGYTKAAKDLLFQKETRNYIKGMVNKRRLLLVWDVIRGCDLVMYGRNERELDEAVNIFMKCLSQTTISLDASMKILTKNKDWDSHLLQITNNLEYTGLVSIEVRLGEIHIVGVDAVFQKLYDDVMKFFDLHGDISEFVNVEAGRFLYIVGNKRRELSEIEKQYSSLSVRIDRIDKANRKGFKVHGKKDGCRLAISRLQEMVDNVTYKDLTITKPGLKEFLQHTEGREELQNIEISEKCVLVPELSDSGESSLSLTNDTPKEAAACKMGCLSISVMEGDITSLKADMIVNPSFLTLNHNIGLGSAIIDKGGFEIQKDCNEHVRINSLLADAEIFISRAGKLPCKCIVHVAMPTWKGGHSNERSVLRQAVENCLNGASDIKCKTLALPVIGAGMFAYPVDVAARNIVEIIKRYGEKKQGSTSIQRIFLCDKKSSNVRAYINELKEKVGSSEVQVYKDSDNSESSGSSNSSRGSVEDFNGRCPNVSVVEGELAKQDVDVIVNSTNQNLDLKVGIVSKGLAKAGGDIIQKECNDRYPLGIKIGDVAKTSGGALRCKRIYHGMLQQWDQGQGNAEAVIGMFIRRCLTEADRSKWTSIAFPALGTGNLGFPAEVVAATMFDCVADFQSTHLKEVKLVVWQGDTSTVKAFHNAYKQFKKEQLVGRRQRTASESFQPSAYLVQNPDKFGSKRGKDFKTTIENVTMEILQGDLTKQKTGAIVNSVLKDLNLSSGNVSKAILDAGGSTIQTECWSAENRHRMEKDGLVVTSPGKLLCRRIIHMKAKSSNQGWEKMIYRVLSQVEHLGLNSVTFPALGTGGRGCTPESMAKLMMSAFRQYITSKDYKQCLKSIRIVIYEARMLETFIKSVNENPSVTSKVLDKLRPRSTPVFSVKIHVYIDSQSHLENVKLKINNLFSEDKIFLPSILLEKLDEKEIQSITRIGALRNIYVMVQPRGGCVQLQGYGNAVDDAKRDIQRYLNKLEDYKMQDTSTSVKLPKCWPKMSLKDPLKIEVLSPNGTEFSRINNKFKAEVGGRQVVKIERIQNPTLFVQYIANKHHMEQANKGSQFPVERCLWHGTSSTVVDSINQTGFNRNFNSGASHGAGVYFAVRATTSLSYCRQPDPNGHYHMYYCHVLTGDCCVGSSGIRNPPAKTRQSSIAYDSTTDSVQSPSFFVIFHDAKAYPSYHIEFI